MAALCVSVPLVCSVSVLPLVMPLVMLSAALMAMLPLPCTKRKLSAVVSAEATVRPPVASLRPMLIALKPVGNSELPVSQATGRFMVAEPPRLMAVLVLSGRRNRSPLPFTVAPKLPQLSICSVMLPVVPAPVL